MNNQDQGVATFGASNARARWKWEVSLRLFLELIEPLFVDLPRLESATFFLARTSPSFYISSPSLDSRHFGSGWTRRLPRSTSASQSFEGFRDRLTPPSFSGRYSHCLHVPSESHLFSVKVHSFNAPSSRQPSLRRRPVAGVAPPVLIVMR